MSLVTLVCKKQEAAQAVGKVARAAFLQTSLQREGQTSYVPLSHFLVVL